MTAVGATRRLACSAASGVAAMGLFWGGYLTLIGFAARRSLRQTREASAPAAAMRFRVLVPAHEEETMIGMTLDSLADLDYPADRFEVHVVADNCHDQTAAIARSRGVNVHERNDPDRPGKGPALSWLIDQLEPGGENDAVVVIDADTLVNPALLAALEESFIDGVPAVQGHYKVKNAESGGDVGFRSAAFAVRHLVRPAGRTALGGTTSLYGNGMAFREPIARRYRWSDSLTEDLEMGLRLLLDGHMIGFSECAVVEAEIPSSLEDAASQNERWEAGRLRVASSYVPRLLRAAGTRAHGRRWAYLDAAIDISLPPLTTVLAATASGGMGVAVLGRGRVRWIGVASAAAGIGLQASHVLHSLQLADAPPTVRRSLMRTPLHIVWKSRILTRVARRRPGSWIRTTRHSEERAA